MKLVIAGSRSIADFKLVAKAVLLSPFFPGIDEIVSGKARGVDKLGEKFAEKLGIPVEPFPADWDKYDKAAGHIRNQEMAEYGDALVAVWDGKSPGTKSMIEKMVREGKPVFIYPPAEV